MSSSQASTTVESLWSDRETTPDTIDEALRRLLSERYAEGTGVTPARVLNMLAFVESAWSGEIANRLRTVGRYHASRLIVLSFDPARKSLDARASTASQPSEPGQVPFLRETVIVGVGERHLDDLRTIADPLLVRDLPTMLWSPHGHPEAVAALLPLAQSILIDSTDEPECQRAIEVACQLSRQLHVVDLAWLRCTPWRERIAAAFDPPEMRPHLAMIASIEIEHHPESTAVAVLLVAWLCSRLRWKASPLLSHGGALTGTARAKRQEVAIDLRSDRDQQQRGLAVVTIRTASGATVVFRQSASGLLTRRKLPSAPEREWTIPGALSSESRILGEGIKQAVLPDSTYVPTLNAAWEMAS